MRRDAERMIDRHCEGQSDEAIQERPHGAGLFRFARHDGLALALALFVGVVAAPSLAAPRTIADCEAIKETDAYNRCLASFGPVRGQRAKTYPGLASDGGRGKSGGAYRAAPRFGGANVSHGRGGRVRMEFTPGAR